jgi:hypothetical protein
LAARPLPPPPPGVRVTPAFAPPPYVAVSATRPDRTLVQQAARLLRAHRALAPQRAAEIRRQRLREIAELEVSACDVCTTEALTTPGSGASMIGGRAICELTLNTRFVRVQAKRAHVPVRMLAAMAMLHEQELCLRGNVPYAAERRLAEQLGNPLLLDLLYAQIDASSRDWDTVEEAVAILRAHGELAYQRYREIERHHLNQVGPLRIAGCRGCLRESKLIGYATPGSESVGMIGCDVTLDLAGLEGEARDWGLGTALVTATVLVHEQEHCVRDPDDHETPAIDQERRLALKVGSARLLEFVTSFTATSTAAGTGSRSPGGYEPRSR